MVEGVWASMKAVLESLKCYYLDRQYLNIWAKQVLYIHVDALWLIGLTYVSQEWCIMACHGRQAIYIRR